MATKSSTTIASTTTTAQQQSYVAPAPSFASPAPPTTPTSSSSFSSSASSTPDAAAVLLELKSRAKQWKLNLSDYERGQLAQTVNLWRAEAQGRAAGYRIARDQFGDHRAGAHVQPFSMPKIEELIENYIKKNYLFKWQEWRNNFNQICPIKPCDVNKWSKMNTACRQCNSQRPTDQN